MPEKDTTVVAVLLIPTKGHEGLLEGGVGGSSPPTAWRSGRDGHWFESGKSRGKAFEDWEGLADALVLAWKGEPVPDGLDRAYRAAGDRPERYHRMSEMPDAGMWFGSVGTVVFLDAQGDEIKIRDAYGREMVP